MEEEKILVVDDNVDTRDNIKEILEDEGYDVTTASNGVDAVSLINNNPVDCLVLDMRLPGKDGWEVLKEIKPKIDAGLAVIIITAYGDISSAVKAVRMGAYDYIEKPFDNDALILAVKRGLENLRLKRELSDLKRLIYSKKDLEEFFGCSKAIKKVLDQINMVASTDISILIYGETGSGKEVIANFIHNRSLRKNNPFVAIDCGALPDSLIESELFGFEKGSFTGAYERKPGKFELANGGTLFLDEVGNLPLSQQQKLLRVLDTKKVLPIGSKKEKRVNTRVIAATNKDLSELVEKGEFRSDLYYRLSEFVIEIPPLRKRQEDIPIIVGNLIREANLELGKSVRSVSEEAMNKLMNYNWPGNVRELRNVIRRAVLVADEVIESENIVLNVSTDEREWEPKRHINVSVCVNDGDKYISVLDEVDKELVKRALEEAGWNISRAAKLYGIDRTNFYRKMKKYGVTRKVSLS